MFVHCVEDLADSPADSWAYQDEDTIGEAARLAKSLHCMTLQRTLMQKYRVQPDNLWQSEKNFENEESNGILFRVNNFVFSFILPLHLASHRFCIPCAFLLAELRLFRPRRRSLLYVEFWVR